ncbi:hypothetical protein B0H66DRAFT_629614 [Apodospora peruviana]|uniref:FAD-binding PCMH-type domain-containing protein n=1 Tax=Apodospora peruviana TaxID=516989 RepID=A0AAE0HVG5_9PEZI|nr:hypothetical protein B0H66DRAFT_629614 [Apodospora peruviana]
MARFFLLQALLAALPLVSATIKKSDATVICEDIDSKISSASDVIFPIQALSFASATNHWYFSSSQTPACVLQVGSVADLSTAMKVIGASRTPFAIMSGGHASNPGFSSTTGVHISLSRMDQVVLSPDNKIAEIGVGNHWSDVFKKLEGTGYNVVGGRTLGPGVGGFTLGGGYSWKTNQFGLTCDTVKSFNLVLPNGTFTKVSATQNPDLFFALKGGMNRFGVVTSVELYTHEQSPQVYGGIAIYPGSSVNALINATSRFFYENTDPRAAVITTLEAGVAGTTALALFFYDGPEKPASFKLFDGITPILNSARKQTFSDFVAGIPAPLSQLRNPRGTFITLSTSELTQRFVEAVKAETDAISEVMALHSGTVASYDIEPFTPYGQYATDSAYPHESSPLPLNLYFAWVLESEDEWWHNKMRESIATLRQVAIEEGIYTDSTHFPSYPNYAITGTPAEELYGPRNAARLRVIRDRVDPDRIMELAGGFEI